jgi:hypothetical protein
MKVVTYIPMENVLPSYHPNPTHNFNAGIFLPYCKPFAKDLWLLTKQNNNLKLFSLKRRQDNGAFHTVL